MRVSGSRFIPDAHYAVKLEGAKRVGFRTVSIACARDPIFIAKVDDIIEGVRTRVADNFSGMATAGYQLMFRLYGRDGVMGTLEPRQGVNCHELGILIEAVAPTQELANTICSFARSTMLHYGYPGRISTAGNLAFPYSPSDFKAGEVYQFSIPCVPFPIEYMDIKEIEYIDIMEKE